MKNKFKLQDKIIISCCIVIILVSWFFILNLHYLQDDKNKNQKIGQVNVKGQDIRKKMGSEYFWQELSGRNDIHMGDSLFAGQKSSANIKFIDGSTLRLNENSLVKFAKKNDVLSIDIAFGQLRVNSKEKTIILRESGKDIKIESFGADIDISKGKEYGDIQIKVKSGQAKIAKKTIKANSPVSSFDLGNNKNPLTKFIKLIEKPRNSKAYIRRSIAGSLEFVARWDVTTKASEYEIEISPDEKMEANIKKYRVKTNSVVLPNVESKKMYYRLRANESVGNATASTAGEFTPVALAELIEKPDYTKAYIRNSASGGLEFVGTWNTVPKASEYEIEISSDEKMEVNLKKYLSKTNGVVLPNVESKKIYYRLRANKSVENGDKFVGEFTPVAVAELMEKPGQTRAYIRNSASGDLEFVGAWNAVPKASEYEIEISSDEKMAVNTKKYLSKTNSVVLPNVESKKMYYRLRAHESAENGDKFVGEFTPVAVAEVREKPRNAKAYIQITPSENSELALKFVAAWEAVARASEYEIEISPDEIMAVNAKKYLSKTNSLVVPGVSSKKMYYRLRANESAEDKGEFGPVGIAEVKEILDPPQIKNAEFKLANQNKLDFVLDWLPADKASQYQIEISKTDDFKNVQTQTVKGVKTKFLDLDQTAAYVRARSENKFIKSKFSEPIFVSFKHQVQDNKDKVISAKCMVRSLAEAGPQKDFMVDWQPIPLAKDYLVKVIDNKNIAQVSQVQARGPASTVTLPACGEYDVKVEAYDGSGRKISSEFNATKIIYKTTLAVLKPVISEAEKNMNFFIQTGMGRSIWLKWKGQLKPGGFFRVEVASDASFTSNHRQFNVKDNKLLFKVQLQKGQYYWRVREHSADFISDWSDLAKIDVIAN